MSVIKSVEWVSSVGSPMYSVLFFVTAADEINSLDDLVDGSIAFFL